MRGLALSLLLLVASIAHAQLISNLGVVPSAALTAGGCVQATGPNTISTPSSAPCGLGSFNPANYLTTATAASTYAPLYGTATLGGLYTFSNIPQVNNAPVGDTSTNIANTDWVNDLVTSGVGSTFIVRQSYVGAYPPSKLSASQIMVSFIDPRDVQFVPVYTEFYCIAPPAASAVFTVTMGGTSLGTVTLNTSCEATWSLTGNDNNSLSVPRGEVLIIQAPATPDNALAGLTISFPGYATASYDH
jgi:hypothetical protein